MPQFPVENLDHFSEEDRQLVKRLMRPQGPSPDFESEEFGKFLMQLNSACGALRQVGAEVPNLSDVMKTQSVSVPSHPPPRLKAAG